MNLAHSKLITVSRVEFLKSVAAAQVNLCLLNKVTFEINETKPES
jgi:hypothetical protein